MADLSAEGRGARGCLPAEIWRERGTVEGSGGLVWREPMREPKPSAELPLAPASGVALLDTCHHTRLLTACHFDELKSFKLCQIWVFRSHHRVHRLAAGLHGRCQTVKISVSSAEGALPCAPGLALLRCLHDKDTAFSKSSSQSAPASRAAWFISYTQLKAVSCRQVWFAAAAETFLACLVSASQASFTRCLLAFGSLPAACWSSGVPQAGGPPVEGGSGLGSVLRWAVVAAAAAAGPAGPSSLPTPTPAAAAAMT